MARHPMRPIPVHEALSIASAYGYDQVIIIARRVGDDPAPHGEHVTTYGVGIEHCGVAARVGNYIKHRIMGWPELSLDNDKMLVALRKIANYSTASTIQPVLIARDTLKQLVADNA